MTLPPEITAEIFVHWGLQCLPPADAIYHMGFNAPVVAGVCRLWRDIALATPMLWSTLRVPLSELNPKQPGSVDEGFIDRWLSRSGVLPLSLFIPPANYALNRLRDIIHRYSRRVQYLDLAEINGVEKLGLDSAVFPSLLRVKLRDVASSNLHPPDIFSNAPRLHGLVLQCQEITPTTFTFPWLQLTKFQGAIWGLDLFTSAPNLIEAECDFEYDPASPLTAVTHHRLNSLTLASEQSMDLLRYLTLPALKILEISDMPDHYYGSFTPFIIRSLPPLVTLSVRADYDCYGQWYLCLPLLARTLENLEIFHASKESTDAMFGTMNLGGLLNLRTLVMEDVCDGVNLQSLVEFLHTRSKSLRSFRIVLRDCPFLDRQVYASRASDTASGHLSRIIQAGMDIYFGTIHKNYVP
ncbi:hypothetical protein DFH06DRAFT_288294 [Mycena polygramma]|nr:hypothetical protein DFH06DRAFT_288294 [Mycena polygramma]